MSTGIPLTVVGGYLGAGKTTLVNHWLREARGMKLAVLVNDFGSLAIDAALIESRTAEVIGIAGGCICCSFGSDLVGALDTLSHRPGRIDHVLVETSGVALPGTVAQSIALLPAFGVRDVVVLADAVSIDERAVDRYVGDTILRQLVSADVVILNKVDLVSRRTISRLRTWLSSLAPKALQIDAVRGAVSLDLLRGEHRTTKRSFQGGGDPRAPAPVARAVFETETYSPAGPVDLAMLGKHLARPASGVARAKGILLDLDGSLKVLQVASGRYTIEPSCGDSVAIGLVCIGARGMIDRLRRAWPSRATGFELHAHTK